MTTVTLYTKPGCHLCEAVEQIIAAVRRKRPFGFVVRNIEHDPADFERYKYVIPVVWVNGAEVARYRLTADELEQALNHARSSPE